MRRLRELLFVVSLLLVWQTHAATIALAHTLPGDSATTSAADATLPRTGAQELSELRCRGAKDALVDAYVIDKLDADTLSLNFNASSRASGPDSKGLDPGTCSWIDRPVKEDEWRQIHFLVTAERAQSIPAYLKNPDNYWSFFVVSSAQGYFDAKRHQAWTTAIKPETPAASSPPVSQPNTPPASFGGNWNMAAGPGSTQFKLSMQQAGNKVTGTFSPQDGTIEGTVSGKTLSFQWTQAGGYKGSGQMEMGGDGKSLTGLFTIVEGPKKGENRVIAERAEDSPQAVPQPSTIRRNDEP
ncbi:MAG: hypothetical protein ACXW3L_04405 [Limisphaerales bacterium]